MAARVPVCRRFVLPPLSRGRHCSRDSIGSQCRGPPRIVFFANLVRERERERAPPPPPRVLDTITSTFHGITMPRLWRSRVFVASPLLFVPFRPQPLTNFRANGGSQGNGEKRLRSSGNGNCFEELFVIVRNGRMRGSMMMRRGGVSSVEKLNNAILSTILIYIFDFLLWKNSHLLVTFSNAIQINSLNYLKGYFFNDILYQAHQDEK